MVLKGKSVFGGIAIGRLSIYNKKENQVKTREKSQMWKQKSLVLQMQRKLQKSS